MAREGDIAKVAPPASLFIEVAYHALGLATGRVTSSLTVSITT